MKGDPASSLRLRLPVPGNVVALDGQGPGTGGDLDKMYKTKNSFRVIIVTNGAILVNRFNEK